MYRLAAYFKIEDGDVYAWLKRISWEQLQAWIKYEKIEPFGEERADLRAGALASVTYNMNLANAGDRTKPLNYVVGALNKEFIFHVLPTISRKQKFASSISSVEGFQAFKDSYG